MYYHHVYPCVTYFGNLSGSLTGFGPCHGVSYLYVLVPQPCRSASPPCWRASKWRDRTECSQTVNLIPPISSVFLGYENHATMSLRKFKGQWSLEALVWLRPAKGVLVLGLRYWTACDLFWYPLEGNHPTSIPRPQHIAIDISQYESTSSIIFPWKNTLLSH